MRDFLASRERCRFCKSALHIFSTGGDSYAGSKISLFRRRRIAGNRGIFLTYSCDGHNASNPTSTFDQGFGGGIGATIDGNLGAANGWAIYEGGATPTRAQTAAFETAVGTSVGPDLTIVLSNLDTSNGQHTIGKFRISVTTDDRSTFDDGLSTGGDVTANWTQLVPLTTLATNGTVLTAAGDNTILASGTNPATSVYTITATNPLGTAITGFRLETFEDPSLPDSGPGRASNGNFVLTEFQVSAVPEPTLALPLMGLAIGAAARRRRS